LAYSLSATLDLTVASYSGGRIRRNPGAGEVQLVEEPLLRGARARLGGRISSVSRKAVPQQAFLLRCDGRLDFRGSGVTRSSTSSSAEVGVFLSATPAVICKCLSPQRSRPATARAGNEGTAAGLSSADALCRWAAALDQGHRSIRDQPGRGGANPVYSSYSITAISAQSLRSASRAMPPRRE